MTPPFPLPRLRLFALSGLFLLLGGLSLRLQGVSAQPASPPVGGPAWIDRCYDCPPLFEALSGYGAAVDSSGTLHVVYGGDGLYHSRQTADGWAHERVDPALGGSQAVLAIDGSDRLHVLYETESPTPRLQYALWDDGAWSLVPIPLPEVAGATQPRLALDAGDRPVAAFSQGGTVYILTYDGASWQVAPIPGAGGGIALAVRQDGTPLLAFQAEHRLALAAPGGSGWTITEVITATSRSSGAVDLVLDSADQPHLLYGETNGLWDMPQHVFYDGSAWRQEQIDIDLSSWDYVLYSAERLRLAITADDTIFAVAVSSVEYVGTTYFDYTLIDLFMRQNGAWQPVTGMGGRYPTLATGGTNDVHLLFTDGDFSSGNNIFPTLVTRIFHWHSGSSELVVAGGRRGYGPQLIRARDGIVHVAAGAEDGSVLYGTWLGSNVGAAPSPTAAYGTARLALSATSDPFFAYNSGYTCYHCFAEYRLVFFDNGWEERPVKTANTSGFDLALTSDGSVHMLASSWVEFGTRQVEQLTISDPITLYYDAAAETVSPILGLSAYEGGGVRLVADQADTLHGLWVDAESRKLIYARRTPAGWALESAADQDARYPGLAVDEHGIPHVAYCDTALSTVTYAVRTASGWVTEAIAPAAGSCYPAITVDGAGQVHVSFYDGADALLHYALRSSGWTVTSLPAAGLPAGESALTLDRLGYPVIAYQDTERGDLRLLTVDYSRRDYFLPLAVQP